MTWEAITVIIALCALIVAFAGYLFTRRAHNEEQVASQERVSTKLDFIADDIKDIKVESRVMRDEIKEVRGIAEHAQETADDAVDMIKEHINESKAAL